MGFRKLLIKAKAKTGRGTLSSKVIITAMKDYWKELQEELEKLPQDEQNEFKDHFNGLIDDEEDLGDILFGNYETFWSRIKNLDDEIIEEYTQEMLI